MNAARTPTATTTTTTFTRSSKLINDTDIELKHIGDDASPKNFSSVNDTTNESMGPITSHFSYC